MTEFDVPLDELIEQKRAGHAEDDKKGKGKWSGAGAKQGGVSGGAKGGQQHFYGGQQHHDPTTMKGKKNDERHFSSPKGSPKGSFSLGKKGKGPLANGDHVGKGGDERGYGKGPGKQAFHGGFGGGKNGFVDFAKGGGQKGLFYEKGKNFGPKKGHLPDQQLGYGAKDHSVAKGGAGPNNYNKKGGKSFNAGALFVDTNISLQKGKGGKGKKANGPSGAAPDHGKGAPGAPWTTGGGGGPPLDPRGLGPPPGSYVVLAGPGGVLQTSQPPQTRVSEGGSVVLTPGPRASGGGGPHHVLQSGYMLVGGHGPALVPGYGPAPTPQLHGNPHLGAVVIGAPVGGTGGGPYGAVGVPGTIIGNVGAPTYAVAGPGAPPGYSTSQHRVGGATMMGGGGRPGGFSSGEEQVGRFYSYWFFGEGGISLSEKIFRTRSMVLYGRRCVT